MKTLVLISQLVVFIAAAPFLSGLITVVKNNLRMRKGMSILQPYHNLAKLFSKGEVYSKDSSWIFKAAPFVVLASSLCAAGLVPLFGVASLANFMGGFLALIFILALGRFFLALAALDTGSPFGGMGSSREMFISSLVEPVLCLVAFVVSLQFRSTNIAAFSGAHSVSIASLVGAVALFLAVLAETSRIPVDNQETHLELTMVHEAMVLEYSGRSLAIIEMASYIKQMIWFLLLAQIVFPDISALTGALIISVIVAVVEVSVAKMRLFRVVDFLGLAFVLGVVAVIYAILGA